MGEQPSEPAAEPTSPPFDDADRSASPKADPPPMCPPQPAFDPSRTMGIIRRKAMIKDLAAAYHAECLASCQELLELQKKWDEVYHSDRLLLVRPYIELKPPEEPRKEAPRPPKIRKKSR